MKKTYILLWVIFLVFAAMLLLESARKSAIFEENEYLTSGYYMLKTNDYRMQPAQPPFALKLGAVPLLFSNPPFPYDNEYCQKFLYYACADKFLYNSGLDGGSAIFWGRVPFIILALLTGFLIFKWAKELYGDKGGLLALVMYAFNATVLGWSALINPDFSAAAFGFISVYFLWKLFSKPSAANAILIGIFFGLAQASKFTAIMLIPAYAAIGILYALRHKTKPDAKKVAKYSGIILSIGFIAMWAVYGFSFGTFASGAPQRFMDIIHQNLPSNEQVSNAALFAIENVPVPFPSYFVGVSAQMFISATSLKSSYINGVVYQGSVWYFHLESFLLKESIAFIILVGISIASLFMSRKKNDDEIIFLLVPILAFAAAFIFIININSGIQHLLSLFPFMFVLTGRLAKLRRLKILVIILTAAYVIGAIIAFPNYISYFNEFVNDDNGHQYFLTANLDQGQNLKELSEYAKANSLEPLKLSYFGTTNPKAYLEYEYLPTPYFLPWVPEYAPQKKDLPPGYYENCSRQEGIVAVSAPNLKGMFLINTSCYSWLHGYKPIKIIGHTIFVYNVTAG
ncbi:MAG: glycosyltransferase family 39 protein [Candidatus Woesearchaeota archaeon]